MSFGTVILFLGESNFGNIGSMVSALAAGLNHLNFDPVIVDVRRGGYENQLMETVRSRDIVAFISVSGFGLPSSPTSDAVRIFNDVGVPIMGVFLDHPFCLRDRIDMPLENYHVTFPASHAGAFCERYIRPGGAFHHLPHGSVERTSIPWADREIDLLMTGSLFLPPNTQRAAWRSHGAIVEAKLNDIVDLVWLDLTRPLEESVREVLGEGADFESLFPYMKTVDDYIRNAQRVDTIMELSHFRPTVVGPGWDAYADELPLVRFVGQKTIQESLEMTNRSRAVLNPFPGYNDSHERVFNAMACGSAVLSSRSAFYQSEFSLEDIFFLPNRASDMPSVVAELLANKDRLRGMAASGHQRFSRAHTWTHRARSLAQIGGVLPVGA